MFVCVRNCVFIVSSRYYRVVMILLVEVQLAWTSLLLCCDMLLVFTGIVMSTNQFLCCVTQCLYFVCSSAHADVCAGSYDFRSLNFDCLTSAGIMVRGM